MAENSPKPSEQDQDLSISGSSVQNSQLGQAGRNLTQIRDSVVKIIKKPVSITVGVLTAIVGAVGIIFGGKHYIISIQGNVGEGSTVANELTIYKGDPPEVRQRKLEQAKSLIAEEIFTNITNMDARLSYVETALEDDNFDQRLQDVRNQIAPSLNHIFDSGYNRLIRQQQISSLRGAFASRQLSEVRGPLIQVLIDGNADAERVRVFYSSLAEVQDVSESLLKGLSTAAAETSTDLEIVSHHKKRVKLDLERLLNRSEIAYLYGLMVLDSLKTPLPKAQDHLSLLQHLKPHELISREEANQLLVVKVKQAESLVKRRAALVEEAKNLRDAKLDEYAKLNKEIVIQPSDPQNEVVRKAIILRELGRTNEAVVAFSRYADMFSEKDPTAKQYSRTAQYFTMQLKKLDVSGGVYLYEIEQSGIADRAGLKVGDIIIGYGDKTIANINDIKMALRDNSIEKNSTQLTYLRMSNTGIFQRQTVLVNSGALGVGMMHI
ncbi:PDZ domain-containing protein [Pseudanabaena sp. PCC 6802]|uniref:PDZ domain-containing protein n=1 Tax=Pseudanabaena sp. PCC 6802 TaxID=118173 RepID=UPI000344F4C7|nr:PDZ domain-containing protein [Pseudanabaena sp. PCC 6802]